jgi:hypothetical protein
LARVAVLFVIRRWLLATDMALENVAMRLARPLHPGGVAQVRVFVVDRQILRIVEVRATDDAIVLMCMLH